MNESRTGWLAYDRNGTAGAGSSDEGGRPSAVSSPCIQVCELNDDQLCTGCRRHMDEIVAWPRMDRATRLAVLAELPYREV